MKILCLATVLLITGCGVADSLKDSCGKDIEMGCNALFGYKDKDQDKAIQDQANKNKEQDARLTALEAQIQSSISFANNLQTEIYTVMNQINDTNLELNNLRSEVTTNNNTVQSQIAVLNATLANLNSTQNSLQSQVTNINSNVVTLMSQMLSVNSSLTVLNGNVNAVQNAVNTLTATVSQSITSMYNPCGASTGFDEILLKTQDGKWIGYFESGSNRYLSVLKPNNSFRTTDSQGCYFTINSAGQIVNEHL